MADFVPSSEMVGVVKIADGLFIGDAISVKEVDFLMNNKVTHIVNCAPYEINDVYSQQKFNINWLNSPSQVLFEGKGNFITSM